MSEIAKPRRVTIRLTPFQARALNHLRHHGRAEGEAARTATEVLIEALLNEERRILAAQAEERRPVPSVVEEAAPLH